MFLVWAEQVDDGIIQMEKLRGKVGLLNVERELLRTVSVILCTLKCLVEW